MSPFGVRDDDRRRRRRRRRLTKPDEMPDNVEKLENNLKKAGILSEIVHRQKGMVYREGGFPKNFNEDNCYRVRLVFPYELTASNDDWKAMEKVFAKLREAMEDDRRKGAKYFEYSTERWDVADGSFWCFIGDSYC